MDAVSLPRPSTSFSMGRTPRLQPHHRYGGRCDQLHEGVEQRRARQALLHLLRARRSHAPHQPTPEWIKKISDMHLFDQGWEKLRETIFANQKRLGVIPANTQLTPWPDGQAEYGGAKLQKWDTLSADEKKLFIRQADVFAAYTAYTDHEICRVIQAVEDIGKLDNTLIIYISGDNGTSAEGSILG